MLFWISLLLLSTAVVAPLVWPLLRSASNPGLSDRDSRLAVQRDRRREIDREEAAGRLSADEATLAREELLESLTSELRTRESQNDASAANPAASPATTDWPASRRRIAAIALAALVPLAAIGVYRTVGQPDIQAMLAAQPANRPITEADVRGIVDDLVRRTEAEPQNGQTWLMLAQALRALDEHARSADAFGRAAALLPPDARLLADQAEMLALSRGRDFGAEPRQLLQSALRIDPDDAKANALMAAVELQAGNRSAALPFLRIVLAGLQPGSEQAGQIVDLIESIGGAGSAADGGSAASAAEAPAQSPVTEQSSADTDRILAGEVRLSGESPPPGTVLFISARAAEGPRMPFAALRIENPNLPQAFTLSNADAMSPQRLLSSAGAVVVEARLSRSGTATRSRGDRFGQSRVIGPQRDARDIVIEIDQTVP